MLDVFFYEAFAEEAAALARHLPAAVRAGYDARTVQECAHQEPPAGIISIRTQSQLPLAWSARVAAVVSRSTGFDHLQAWAGRVARAPALGYLPLYCHRAVAEQALLLWLALLRRLPLQQRQFQAFHRDGLTGRECLGRTLVVVGVGAIGGEAARLGAALGMRVLGVDRAPRHPAIEHVGIDQALPQADVVLCAMDLNRTNRGFFDQARLGQVRPGTVFVNVSRGELSPSTALLAALEAGQLGGVGIDVYDHEAALAVALRAGAGGGLPPAGADPEALAALALARRPDVICTPHNAFNTEEAVERKSEHTVRQVLSMLGEGRLLWSVPPE